MSNNLPQHEQQQQQKKTTLGDFLAARKTHIEQALPKHMKDGVKRVVRIAMTEISKNPRLQECTPDSLFGAIIQSCILGLEPGSLLGHSYLIPYDINKNVGTKEKAKWEKFKECQFMLGYRGMIELARRSGQVVTISAHVVYENDSFVYEYGLNEQIVHVPTKGNKGHLAYVYAIAKLSNGGKIFEVMDREEIYKIRDRSKAYIGAHKKEESIWVKDESEMWRKTAVRRLFKYLPTSIEIIQAIELDDAGESGQQNNSAILDAEYETLGLDTEIGVLSHKQKEAKLEEVFNKPEKAEEVKKEDKSIAEAVAREFFGEDDK